MRLQILSASEIEGLCGRHQSTLERKEQGVGGDGGKSDKEVKDKGLKLSITENGEDGKSKMIASCGCLEENYVNAVRRKE